MSAAESLSEEPRRIGGIPIRNLYVMLAFADSLHEELSAQTCGAVEHDELPLDILARLLAEKLTWIRRRGTPRTYRVRDDVGAVPEGTIDISVTLRGMHLLHNRLAFQVDELQMDTPQNQLLCAGIRALLRSPKVKDDLRDGLRRQLSAFSGISYISNHDALRISWTASRGVYSSYCEALGLARLAVLSTLPDESAHDQHWRKLLDDQERMGALFEKFIRGFLRFEFGDRGSISQRNYRWSDDASEHLPQLKTDVVIELHGADRLTIGECKLYKSPLVVSHHDGRKRLRPAHVNQLFAYLAAAEDKHSDRKIEGLLIYAQVDEDFSTDLTLRQFPVRVRTLNLHDHWPKLREQLVKLWPASF